MRRLILTNKTTLVALSRCTANRQIGTASKKARYEVARRVAEFHHLFKRHARILSGDRIDNLTEETLGTELRRGREQL